MDVGGLPAHGRRADAGFWVSYAEPLTWPDSMVVGIR